MSEDEKANREANLKAIEDCGAAEMPVAETCIIAEMSEDEYSADKEAQARYQMGHLKTKLAVRQSVVKMAKEGVPQMVKIYLEFNQDPQSADFDQIGGVAPLAEAEKKQPAEFADI